MLAVLSMTDCSSWKYFKISFTALEFTLTLPQALQQNRSGTLNLRAWLNKQILKRHKYNLKSMEILKMCADEMWAGEKYWETTCCVKKQFLWKPMEQQHVHDGFHLLGQIKETVFLYPLSSRTPMQRLEWSG